MRDVQEKLHGYQYGVLPDLHERYVGDDGKVRCDRKRRRRRISWVVNAIVACLGLALLANAFANSFSSAQAADLIERAADGRYILSAGYGVTLALPEELAKNLRLPYTPNTSECFRIREDMLTPTAQDIAGDEKLAKCFEDGFSREKVRTFNILAPKGSWAAVTGERAPLVLRDLFISVAPGLEGGRNKYDNFPEDKFVLERVDQLGYEVYRRRGFEEYEKKWEPNTRPLPYWIGFLLPGPARTPPSLYPRKVACGDVGLVCGLHLRDKSARFAISAAFFFEHIPQERWDDVELWLRTFMGRYIIGVSREDVQ